MSSPRSQNSVVRRRALGVGSGPFAWRLASLGALGVLAACASSTGLPPGQAPGGIAAGVPPALPRPSDPVAAFAARGAPGSVEQVTLEDGQSARLRLARSYVSANGRPCREVLVGAGMNERAEVVCQDGGAWITARPLLRGGAVGQR